MKDHVHSNCQMFFLKMFGLTNVSPFINHLHSRFSGNISHEVTFSCKLIFSLQLLRSKLIKPISQPAYLPSLLANLQNPSPTKVLALPMGSPLSGILCPIFFQDDLVSSFLEERNWFQSYGSIFLAKLFWKLHQYTQLLDQESIMRRHWKGLLSASVFLQDVFGSELQNSKTFFTWE